MSDSRLFKCLKSNFSYSNSFSIFSWLLALFFGEALSASLNGAPTTLDGLDEAMLQVQSQFQSTVPSSSVLKLKPWQDETLRGTLSTAWRHLHQARAESGNGLRSLFDAWRHIHQFLKLITSTRKHCRRLGRERLLSFLDEAAQHTWCFQGH